MPFDTGLVMTWWSRRGSREIGAACQAAECMKRKGFEAARACGRGSAEADSDAVCFPVIDEPDTEIAVEGDVVDFH